MDSVCEVFVVYVEKLWVRVQSQEPDCLGLNPNSALFQLYDSG